MIRFFSFRFLALFFCSLSVAPFAIAQQNPLVKPRARDLGVPFDGTPGPFNAITDVAGVLVGHTTLISGEGKLQVGKGPVRTGVTAVLPRGKDSMNNPVFAGWWSLNGNGEMTGTTWVEESGFLEGPVMITNTHSVGVVRDAVIQWRVTHGQPDPTGYWWSLPVVAETWDGWLNDINGFHVKSEHAFHAIDSAASGPVQEGNVGGGTGMICNEFKGGIGTSSRKLAEKSGGYTVGVLLQCNYGVRPNLRIAGVPVGREIPEDPAYASASFSELDRGSIIVVVATDAPLVSHQLKRLARRVSLGLGRNGSISGNGSGDIFIAFSTANPGAAAADHVVDLKMLPNDKIEPVFAATVQATEEAVINAMVAAETMTGINDHKVIALPHDKLRDVLKKYNRLEMSSDHTSAVDDKAGPYSLSNGLTRSKENQILMQIRSFLWDHWASQRKGQLEATAYTIEGDPTTYTFFIESDASGKWCIRARSESIISALLKPTEKPRRETKELRYYVIERFDIESGKVIPKEGKQSPEAYRLRLENEDGPKDFVW
jgi:D-aminopeptidase